MTHSEYASDADRGHGQHAEDRRGRPVARPRARASGRRRRAPARSRAAPAAARPGRTAPPPRASSSAAPATGCCRPPGSRPRRARAPSSRRTARPPGSRRRTAATPAAAPRAARPRPRPRSTTYDAGSSRRIRRAQNCGQAHRAGAVDLAQEVRGDQEAGDHEEDVDADVAAGQPVGPQVEQHHQEHGHRPQPLDLPTHRSTLQSRPIAAVSPRRRRRRRLPADGRPGGQRPSGGSTGASSTVGFQYADLCTVEASGL